MDNISTLKIEAGMGLEKSKQLLALVEAATSANATLQSALEHLAEALRDGGLVLQSRPDSGEVVNLTSLPASAGDDLPLAE